MVEGGPETGSGSKPASSFESGGGRLRFTVELRPDETTIVSWKKLLKEANSSESDKPGTSNSGPEEARIELASQVPTPIPPVKEAAGKEVAEDLQAETGPNRLSNVIERIERMYAGNGSSDEEDVVLDNMPDDDEYDTDDSFIDDAELDDYFQVDNSRIKHDGFFINRGKLERTEPIISTDPQPKKRRRNDLTKVRSGSGDDGGNANKQMKIETKGKKASSSMQRNSTSQLQKVAVPIIHGEDTQFLASPAGVSEVSLKKKTADTKTKVDPSEPPNGDAIRQGKDIDQHRPHVISSKTQGSKSELQDPSAQKLNDKSSHVRKSISGKQVNKVDGLDQSIQRKEKSGPEERFDLNIPATRDSLPTTKAGLMQRKEGPSARPKSTTLEKAIRELEKTVAESRPPSTEVQDPDNASQAVKKRLPPEIKQKLSIVARLTQASDGTIPKEVINRLMSIVGHLMQVRTLKKNLRDMANVGLSAKQERGDRVKKIKQEVAEMIKLRVPYMKSKVEQQAANSDDFQEAGPLEKEALRRKYSMDDVLEDKICDLYDLYVERIQEDSGPPVRRLYEELVVLWPDGFMDVNGIKRGIYKAKERRGLCRQPKDQERIKKKKVPAPKPENAMNVTREASLHIRDKLSSDSHRAASRVPIPIANDPNKSKQETMKGSSSSSRKPIVAMKLKKKPNSEVAETQSRLEKLAVSQVDEQRHKQRKHVVAVPLAKSNVKPAVPSGSDRMQN